MIVIIGILIMIVFRQCENQSSLERQFEQNRVALTDNVKILKNAVGELTWQKAAFVSTIDDMKKYNEKLYNEALEINGKVKSLQNINAQLIITEIKKSIDSLKVKNIALNGGIKSELPWTFEEKYGSFSYYLEGHSDIWRKDSTLEYLGSYLTRQKYNLKLKTYITNVDGILQGGVEPFEPTPGLTFDIETGIFEIPKDMKSSKNWSIGIGPYIGLGYNKVMWSSKEPSFAEFGWSVGIGLNLNYTLFSF